MHMLLPLSLLFFLSFPQGICFRHYHTAVGCPTLTGFLFFRLGWAEIVRSTIRFRQGSRLMYDTRKQSIHLEEAVRVYQQDLVEEHSRLRVPGV